MFVSNASNADVRSTIAALNFFTLGAQTHIPHTVSPPRFLLRLCCFVSFVFVVLFIFSTLARLCCIANESSPNYTCTGQLHEIVRGRSSPIPACATCDLAFAYGDTSSFLRQRVAFAGSSYSRSRSICFPFPFSLLFPDSPSLLRVPRASSYRRGLVPVRGVHTRLHPVSWHIRVRGLPTLFVSLHSILPLFFPLFLFPRGLPLPCSA